jgi:hypothetical protein
VNRLVEFPLEGGGSVVVEVAESELPEGPVRAARPGEIAAKATQSFEAALAKVRPAAEGIIANLRSISVPPAEIEVEFSIKLSAGAGAFIASAGGEAHYRVHLKWQRE